MIDLRFRANSPPCRQARSGVSSIMRAKRATTTRTPFPEVTPPSRWQCVPGNVWGRARNGVPPSSGGEQPAPLAGGGGSFFCCDPLHRAPPPHRAVADAHGHRSHAQGAPASRRAGAPRGPGEGSGRKFAGRAGGGGAGPCAGWPGDLTRWLTGQKKSNPPPCLWARSGRVLRSSASFPEPQSSLLRIHLGDQSPNSQFSRAFPQLPWALSQLVA